MRKIKYTFILELPKGEDEYFEGQFEDSLDYVLETVQYIDGASRMNFSLDLIKKVVDEGS